MTATDPAHQNESTPNLTPEGQRLETAMVEAGAMARECLLLPKQVLALNAAAALLLTAPEGEGSGLREALDKAERALTQASWAIGRCCCGSVEKLNRKNIDAVILQVRATLDAALTKQPAAQEPAAAGVGDAAYEAAWNEYRWMGGPGYTDSSASTAFLEGRNAALRAALAPAAPKTPDAATGGSVGDGGLREALTDMLAGWQYIRKHHGDLYGVGWDRAEEKAVAALAQPAPVGEDETGVRPTILEASEPRPTVATDFALTCRWADGTETIELVSEKAAALLGHSNLGPDEALAPQPPEAETPAGVGEIIQIAEGLRDFVRAAWAYIEGTEYGPEECQPNPEDWLELAGAAERLKALIPAREQPAQIGHAVTMLITALSTAPAARPGDEVSGFVLVPREPTAYAMRMGARAFVGLERYARDHEYVDAQIAPQFAEVYRAMIAAAPAADGGRA